MREFDLQDALLIVGIVSLVAGVAALSRPAAAIVFGLICLGLVRTIGRARAVRQPEGKN